MEYDASQPLISIHVPKTAGSSFRGVLEKWFGPKLHFHYADDERGTRPVKHAWLSGTCIHGHFNRNRGFGVLHYYRQAAQYITFLRDPFATTVSNYFYLKQHRASFPFEDRRVTLDTLCGSLENFLQLAIAHPGSVPGFTFLQYMPKLLTAENYREELFGRFLHVGVTEHMQPSLDALAEKLGQRRITVPVENISRYDEPVPAHLRSLHERAFPLEHEIYQAAREQAEIFPIYPKRSGIFAQLSRFTAQPV